MLVEDDERVARAESWILEQAGFAVTVAGTGPDGLALARAELPMAVILDGDLPGLDGFEVCRRLKADPKTRHIPVLFCSGRFDSRELARAAGANDSVEKTDAVAELVERLNRLLGL